MICASVSSFGCSSYLRNSPSTSNIRSSRQSSTLFLLTGESNTGDPRRQNPNLSLAQTGINHGASDRTSSLTNLFNFVCSRGRNSLTASPLLAPAAAASPSGLALSGSVALLLLQSLALAVIFSTPILVLVAPFSLQYRALAALADHLFEPARVLDGLFSVQAQNSCCSLIWAISRCC